MKSASKILLSYSTYDTFLPKSNSPCLHFLRLGELSASARCPGLVAWWETGAAHSVSKEICYYVGHWDCSTPRMQLSKVPINCLKLDVTFSASFASTSCWSLLHLLILIFSQNFVHHLHEMKQQLRNGSSKNTTRLLLLYEPVFWLATRWSLRSERCQWVFEIIAQDNEMMLGLLAEFPFWNDNCYFASSFLYLSFCCSLLLYSSPSLCSFCCSQ